MTIWRPIGSVCFGVAAVTVPMLRHKIAIRPNGEEKSKLTSSSWLRSLKEKSSQLIAAGFTTRELIEGTRSPSSCIELLL